MRACWIFKTLRAKKKGKGEGLRAEKRRRAEKLKVGLKKKGKEKV
jgi:hypothetical protein